MIADRHPREPGGKRLVGSVFYRQVIPDMPRAIAGDGPYVLAADGRRYLDACSGAGVSCLGHSDEAVKSAIKAQIDELPYAHTRYYTTDAMERLGEELTTGAPAGLTKVWFTCGGSEAVEAALKIARQYFVEIGEPERCHFIGRHQGYHGNTIGALSVGGNLYRRAKHEPILLRVAHHIGPCFAYRGKAPDETEEAYGLRAADELEAKIVELGPGAVAAFIAETVVGSTTGAVPPVQGYFRRIRDICDEYGVLLVLDEIMCGMGRTGTRYACAQEGIAPDMIALAKGLSGGYLPLGALLVADKIHAAIRAGSGNFLHGHTFMGHAASCAAGLAVQREIRRRDLLANVRRQGEALDAALRARFGNHPYVGDIRGRGLMQCIELVADRGTKEPFDPALSLHARINELAMENGLMCYPMGGTVDGWRGDHVMLMPPYIISQEHVDETVEILGEVVDSVLAEAFA